MNGYLTTTMGSSFLGQGRVSAAFAAPRVRAHIGRRGKRETLAMRVALAVGGPRLARPRTLAQLCRAAAGPARRLAGVSAAVAVIALAETALSVLSR